MTSSTSRPVGVDDDPPAGDRLIDGAVLDGWCADVARVAGAECADLFAEAMIRTLQRTLHRLDDGSYFVITGDIPAMWLRDSSTQMLPYLRLVEDDPDGPLTDVLAGVVRRQLISIAHDPYANAFNIEANGRCHDPADLSDDPWLWERKYEIDSLCFPFQLAHRLWRATGRIDQSDELFLTAAGSAVATLRRETRHAEESEYRFVRHGGPASETLPRDGRGGPVGWTGMTWSGFRPSDDACELGYNIPGNLMAAHTLRLVAEVTRTIDGEAATALAGAAETLADQIDAGARGHGTVDHPEFGQVLAYEVDGLGHQVLMDDANMPGLLSLPLISARRIEDPLYRRTRAMILSAANPYYYQGSVAAGIGSPHTPARHVWPIALAVEGLTETDGERRLALLQLIARTTAGTGSVHESFHVEDDRVFTRPWFSWADSMFCALAMDIARPASRVRP